MLCSARVVGGKASRLSQLTEYIPLGCARRNAANLFAYLGQRKEWVMTKWVLGLCATIYMTLMVFGGAPEEEATTALAAVQAENASQVAETVIETDVETVAVAPEAEVQTVKVASPAGGRVDLALVAPIGVTPLALPVVEAAATESPTVIETPSPEVIEAAAEVATQPAPRNAAPRNGVGEIWTVTGSTVNLRSQAGTFGDVIGQTRRGNSAEVIELLDNGWAKVFILESGLEAYMSADYLRREQG